MPIGIKSAQEVFQKRMSQSFGDIEGVETDVDDILVWGTTAEEHYQRLKKTLQRCEQINLTLNQSKCEFGTTEVVYIGHNLIA
jgi:TATA-binding protein-associated factor Taf7